MSTGTDMTCGYCGRPIVGPMTWGAAGPYHPECTRGPTSAPQYYAHVPMAEDELRRRLDEPERKVLALLANEPDLQHDAWAVADGSLPALVSKLNFLVASWSCAAVRHRNNEGLTVVLSRCASDVRRLLAPWNKHQSEENNSGQTAATNAAK